MKNLFTNKRLKKEVELKDNEILELTVELNNANEILESYIELNNVMKDLIKSMEDSLKSKDIITPLINLHYYNNILNKHPDDIPDDILIDCITSLYRIVQISWVVPSTIYFLKNIFTKCYELLFSRDMTSKFEKELDILSCTLILP